MTFRLVQKADTSGTALVADFEVAPIDLVRALGIPQGGIEEKVSGSYTFIEGTRVFILYDYKATSQYDRRLPSPLVFWNSRSKVRLSVGSNSDDVQGFLHWLSELVASASQATS